MTVVRIVLYVGLFWVWFSGVGGAGMCGVWFSVWFSDRMGGISTFAGSAAAKGEA